MSNIIVFHDSHEAEGFVKGVAFINYLLYRNKKKLSQKYLEQHELKIKLQFIEDFVSDEGEFAYCVSIDSDDLPETVRTGPRLEVTEK
ncbi:MAG TPA: hypothetical protein DEG69_20440 [Flavobacteriaceae bacterium]|nr:hypothetical protein [Flavobacteriaceae bacterium]|tara:strand:- start:183 stop:446 length:264 start_codon:yes stop_codon:yes gene_type:complete